MTIAQIQNLPDGTPVDEVQGILSGVYDRRPTDKGSVQNATLEDVGGNQVKIAVWDHPDIGPMKGKEVVIFSQTKGIKSAVKVKHSSYVSKKEGPTLGKTIKDIGLSVSKSGQFQTVEVYRSVVAPGAPIPADSSPSAAPVIGYAGSVGQNAYKPTQMVAGAKVGMLINNAVLILTTAGQECTEEAVFAKASELKRVSDRLESGETFGGKPAAVAVAAGGYEDTPF